MFALELLPEFQCNTCTTLQRKERGCASDRVIPIELDGEELVRCPSRPLLDDPMLYSELFWLYRSYKEGHMPEASTLGLYGQPHRLLRMFRVIDGAFSDLQAEKDNRRNKVEEAKKKAKALAG